MKYKDFPQANVVLQKGDNENTTALRVEKCQGPKELYSEKTEFFASQFEYEEDEVKLVRERLEKAMRKHYQELHGTNIEYVIDPGALDAIMKALPPIWVISMHGWAPKIISVYGPGDLGYTHVPVDPKPIDN